MMDDELRSEIQEYIWDHYIDDTCQWCCGGLEDFSYEVMELIENGELSEENWKEFIDSDLEPYYERRDEE